MSNFFRKLLFLFSLLLISRFCFGQYFSSGQDPASVKWFQIKTENFKIIYPENYPHANYIANVLEYARNLDLQTLTAKTRKIPLILHNQTSTSNGLTAWAPKRIEFYSVPPQDSYGQEWFQQLSLHEYRHVLQLSKIDQGFTNVLTWFFGEQATAAVFGLYLPKWFLEGDAVSAETGLSHTGRGRVPSFEMPLRSQVLEKGIYSYDKAVLGSFRDFIPNYYTLGYCLVAQARKNYGPEIWNHTLDNVARRPYLIVPFSEGIRSVSGLNKTGLYKKSLSELKMEWQSQFEKTEFLPFEKIIINKKNTKYINYYKPHYWRKKSVIAEKKTFNDISRFIIIDPEGNEKILFTPGYYFPGSLTCSDKAIAWAEKQFDPRWENRNYSVLKLFDYETSKCKKLTSKTRLFSPSFSPDGQKIAAVEVTEINEYFIVIIDAVSGDELSKTGTDENYFFTNPTWSTDGSKIVSIVIGDNGKSIALINPVNSKVECLIPFTYTEISRPVMSGKFIVFTGAYSGIDNLFALDTETGNISKITSVKYGVSDHSFSDDGKKIIFTNYTANGFEIAEIEFPAKKMIPLEKVRNNSVKLYESLASQEKEIMENKNIPDKKYESKKYSKLLHLFNPHSWAPLSIDAANYDIKPGVSLMSQNVLSSTFATLGYEWDVNEKTGKYYINLSYKGLYPVFDFKADYGRRKSYTYDDENNRIDYSWMETNFSVIMSLPFNLTCNKYRRFIRPSVGFMYKQLDMDESTPVSFKRSNIKTTDYRIYFNNLLKSTEQDMYPRWGQIVDLNLRTAPFKNDTAGSILAAETKLFFPGLIKHHSFNIYAGYQKRFEEGIYYSTIVNYPRGFSIKYSEELISCAANYKFPVCYPDLSLSSLVYFKRVKTNLFCDYAKATTGGKSENYLSTGFELFIDFHVIRFFAPFEFGYRFIFRPEFDDIKSEFLFSINLYSF